MAMDEMLTGTEPQFSDVCHVNCLTVHAIADAVENFFDATGIDPYSLSTYADRREGMRWDNITTADQFQQVMDYLLNVAADYLREGNFTCIRAED